jgi:hypothetical protein
MLSFRKEMSALVETLPMLALDYLGKARITE